RSNSRRDAPASSGISVQSLVTAAFQSSSACSWLSGSRRTNVPVSGTKSRAQASRGSAASVDRIYLGANQNTDAGRPVRPRVDPRRPRATAVDCDADRAVPAQNEVHAARAEVQPQPRVTTGDDPFCPDRPAAGIREGILRERWREGVAGRTIGLERRPVVVLDA